MDYRQSQKIGLYLVSKLHEDEEHLDAGLDQLCVREQRVLINRQSQQKT